MGIERPSVPSDSVDGGEMLFLSQFNVALQQCPFAVCISGQDGQSLLHNKHSVEGR